MTLTPDDIRARVRDAKVSKPKKEWVAPTRDDFARTHVIAFDQTINGTGAVYLDNRRINYVRVPHIGYFPPPKDDLKSFEATLQRTAWLESAIEEWLRTVQWGLVHIPAIDWPHVIHEMPAVQGYRTESSLMAAYAVRKAARAVFGAECGVVSNLHAKAFLVGSTKASKAEVKKAVNGHIADWQRTTGPWNEHTVDATMLGLTFLGDLRVQEEAA